MNRTKHFSIYRILLLVSSVGLVAFCSWRGVGNMLIGFWVALVVVGVSDCMNGIEAFKGEGKDHD